MLDVCLNAYAFAASGLTLIARSPYCRSSMNERYIKWHTPWLSRDFEMLAFGDGGGLPLILFPTSFGRYYDDNIYFNSPFHYLPNTTDPWKYNHMGIIIGTGEWDNTRHESYRLSEILNSKGIQHWLDDGKWRGHDWNYWRDMLPYYLSKL